MNIKAKVKIVIAILWTIAFILSFLNNDYVVSAIYSIGIGLLYFLPTHDVNKQ